MTTSTLPFADLERNEALATTRAGRRPTMTTSTLPFADLERVYERLAETLDALPESQETPFLAQLALALAHRIPDSSEVEAAIREARRASEDAGK